MFNVVSCTIVGSFKRNKFRRFKYRVALYSLTLTNNQKLVYKKQKYLSGEIYSFAECLTEARKLASLLNYKCPTSLSWHGYLHNVEYLGYSEKSLRRRNTARLLQLCNSLSRQYIKRRGDRQIFVYDVAKVVFGRCLQILHSRGVDFTHDWLVSYGVI